MADFTVTSAQIGKYEIALTANVARSVEFRRDLSVVEVTALSAEQSVYFTVDGSAPTVAGSNCYALLPGTNAMQVEVATNGNTLVRLISAGAATVNVSRT